MTEKRLRKGPPGTARRPRCEDMYSPFDNPSRTRFLTSDNILFDVVDDAVSPSLVMKKAIYQARRAAEQPLRVEPPPTLPPFPDAGVSPPSSESTLVALRHAPHLLPNVAAEPLESVLQYCYFHTSSDRAGMNQASIAAWDDEFVRVSPRQLCELASAAYYLDICDLVDLTCRAIASIISGKTAEQIRTTFHIENDLVQSLIFPRNSIGAPCSSQPKPKLEHKKVPSLPPNTDDCADSDEQDPKQTMNLKGTPQLGRNTVEEVENWINGEDIPKKTSKKRRKKKKNKTLSSSADVPTLETRSLPTSSVSMHSPTSSRELPTESLRSSSPVPVPPQWTKGGEYVSPPPNDVSPNPDHSETQQDQDSLQEPILTTPSSDDDVKFVSMTTRHEVGTTNARQSEPSSPPSSPLPSATVPQQSPKEEEKNDDEDSVWTIRSDESVPVLSGRKECSPIHASPDHTPLAEGDESQCRDETRPESTWEQPRRPVVRSGEATLQGGVESKSAFRRVRDNDSSLNVVGDVDQVLPGSIVTGSTNCGSTGVAQVGGGLEGYCNESSHLPHDPSEKKLEGEIRNVPNERPGALRSTGPGVKQQRVEDLRPKAVNPRYIRCPTRMDKEVADFENRLRVGDDHAEPNTCCGSRESEAPQPQGFGHSRRIPQSLNGQENHLELQGRNDRQDFMGSGITVGKPEREGLIQDRLKEVRREAQLVEREKHLQQRADALGKQIADLRKEREKVRDELSLVKVELRQFRNESGA